MWRLYTMSWFHNKAQKYEKTAYPFSSLIVVRPSKTPILSKISMDSTAISTMNHVRKRWILAEKGSLKHDQNLEIDRETVNLKFEIDKSCKIQIKHMSIVWLIVFVQALTSFVCWIIRCLYIIWITKYVMNIICSIVEDTIYHLVIPKK